jgi:hypothetical protein
MRIVFFALMLLAAPALGAPPTTGEVAERLLDDLLAPVARAVESQGYLPRIALHAADFSQEDLETSVTGFFFDRGFDVWLLQPEDPAPDDGPLVLGLTLDQATLTYPRTDDGTLGLGSRRLLRRVTAAMTGTLEDPLTGRRLWQGSPEAQYEDWIDEDDRDALGADRPQWLKENQAAGLGSSKAAWKEKAAVLGLLGGVIILYFSGAN